MKFGAKLLAAGAALLMSTQANAASIVGQISVGGFAAPVGSSGFGGATGYDAVAGALGTNSPGVAGGLTNYGAGTGSFVGLACASVAGECGTIADILDFATFVPISNFLTLNVNGIAFDLASISNITRTSDGTGGSLTLTGNGTIRMTGLDATPGLFTLTAQGRQITSFSASAAAVPEPGTWAMMIIGFGALGYSLRRRRRHSGMLTQLA
jgi:hypothetical protein